MGLQNNNRLAAILLGFLFLGGLLACEASPPYDAIPIILFSVMAFIFLASTNEVRSQYLKFYHADVVIQFS